MLSVWLHQPTDRAAALDLSRELRRDSLVGRAAGRTAKAGSQITLLLKPRDLITGEAADRIEKSVVFNGAPVSVDLLVKCPSEYDNQQLVESIHVLVAGLKIAELLIELHFDGTESNIASAAFRSVRSAFASYAHEDIVEVMARLQAIEKALPGIRIFWDREGLRSGDKWQQRLASEVISKDVFYLFWSEHAAQSRWVEWEWQWAYREKGLDYIDPLPLDSTDPPPELSALQFADRWVRHLQFERLLREAVQNV